MSVLRGELDEVFIDTTSKHNYTFVISFAEMSLSEDLAKFLNYIATEHGWWHRMPLKSNDEVAPTDSVFPNTSLLFHSSFISSSTAGDEHF